MPWRRQATGENFFKYFIFLLYGDSSSGGARGQLGEGTPPALESFDCSFLPIWEYLTVIFFEIGRI